MKRNDNAAEQSLLEALLDSWDRNNRILVKPATHNTGGRAKRSCRHVKRVNRCGT
jgi:hypothetical protein